MGVSEATFYIWKKKTLRLGISELRQLRSREDENASRLKRLVADLSLDKHTLTHHLVDVLIHEDLHCPNRLA